MQNVPITDSCIIDLHQNNYCVTTREIWDSGLNSVSPAELNSPRFASLAPPVTTPWMPPQQQVTSTPWPQAQVFGQLRGGGSGFTCPEKNGRFPSPQQCDAYIECEEGVPTEKLCPDGLLFNPNARFFAYPCQYPVNVDCEGRSALQPAQPTDDCPRQYGYFLRGDISNCGKFVNCADGVGYEFDCPEGLAFNPDSLLCDWPDQVPACDAEAFLGFRCPEPNGRYDDFQFFRSPADCQKYFICVNGRPRLYSCGAGEAFNEEFGGCDGIENVTACNNQQNLRLATTTPRPINLPTQSPYQFRNG